MSMQYRDGICLYFTWTVHCYPSAQSNKILSLSFDLKLSNKHGQFDKHYMKLKIRALDQG